MLYFHSPISVVLYEAQGVTWYLVKHKDNFTFMGARYIQDMLLAGAYEERFRV
jgi:hypothetical protein